MQKEGVGENCLRVRWPHSKLLLLDALLFLRHLSGLENNLPKDVEAKKAPNVWIFLYA